MAKRSALTLTNAVLTRLGESTVTVLTSLTGVQLRAFDAINEAIMEIYATHPMQSLERFGTVTLLTNTYTYQLASDRMDVDIKSFYRRDGQVVLTYREPAEWYQAHRTVSDTGFPDDFTIDNDGVVLIGALPAAAQNTKLVYYRYWKRPLLLSTGSPNQVGEVPEEYEDVVLVPLALSIALGYQGDPESERYEARVWGSERKPGSIRNMIRMHGSPIVKNRVSYMLARELEGQEPTVG